MSNAQDLGLETSTTQVGSLMSNAQEPRRQFTRLAQDDGESYDLVVF